MSERHVIVLGGGPAGLAAASGALAEGARVTLLDEGERLGGQYWRHHEQLTDARLQHGWSAFVALREVIAAACESGRATVLQRAAVWRIDGAARRVHALLGVADAPGRRRVELTGDAIVLATGAHDRALPLPGWTLPGVTTAGAAQALAKRDGVAVGRRTLVAGAGPFLLPVAQSIALVGGEVVGVLEASRVSSLAAGWLARPWELLGAGRKAGELAEYAASLARHRTPYRTGHGVVRILGERRVEAAVMARLDADWRPLPGTEREVACDAVALGHGFMPRIDAALQAGCVVSASAPGEPRFVQVDELQRTSVEGVLAAGEITGIGGADAALAEGEIAGRTAAGAARGALGAMVRRRTATDAFARRLADAHGIRDGWRSWVEDDTVVCRCESVDAGTIARAAGSASRAMRLATRAGLGACQGRTCGAAVEALCGERLELDRRPLLAPLRLSELAAEAAEGREARGAV
ncbi:FAD-dependent oxidoreductase [Agrococcus sp. DT81.2]|uniref:FAD-dependent oxidoreductase n=1 Tax=Agrococcus sp. DT81.2 TaxID=3393414 RepID=UPI003CE44D47